MGTDIFYHAELRTDDGNWETIFDESGQEEFFYFGGGRNYELYEILCGKVDPETNLTSRGFEPIAPRRGHPDELKRANVDDDDGRSWLLLQELIDVQWETKFRHFVGYANAENFRLFFDGDRFRFSPVSPKHPYNSQAFPKPEWTVVSNDEMLELLVGETEVPDNVYTQIEFSRSYAEAAPYILTDTIPKLLKFGEPRDIRILFWFDC